MTSRVLVCQGVADVIGSPVSGHVSYHGFSCVRVCLTSRVLACHGQADVTGSRVSGCGWRNWFVYRGESEFVCMPLYLGWFRRVG